MSTEADNKRLSRLQAKRARKSVLHRANGCCEVCGLRAWQILKVHHVKPIAEGGASELSNLIVLCPNCHEIIHHINYGSGRDMAEALLQEFSSWIYDTYGEEQFYLLAALAYQTAKYRNGRWISESDPEYDE